MKACRRVRPDQTAYSPARPPGRAPEGDVLLVDLESRQVLREGKLYATYEIKKVLEHKTSAEQLSLF